MRVSRRRPRARGPRRLDPPAARRTRRRARTRRPVSPPSDRTAGRRELAAVRQPLGLVGVEVAANESCRRHVVERRQREISLELGKRSGRAEVEGSDPRSAQRGEMATDTQRRTDIARQRPDVRAGRAGHLASTSTHARSASVPFDRTPKAGDVEAADRDLTAGEDDVLAGAHACVRALAVDLDRADAPAGVARFRPVNAATAAATASSVSRVRSRRRRGPDLPRSSVDVVCPSRIVAT